MPRNRTRTPRVDGLQRLAAIGELGAGVVHESRNIMTAVVGFAQLARHRGGVSESTSRFLELIERESIRCLAILDGYLRMARQQKPALERVDVNRIVEEVGMVARPQLAMRQVRLEIDRAPDLPCVAGRAVELQQVLLNLVINAMHAMPSGGELRVTTSDLGSGCVEIAVHDTGVGIPPEIRDKIFQPFYSTKPSGAGTGLGLTLSRQLVAAHGGTLSVTSEVDKGSTFTVRLPIEQDGEEP